MKTRSLSLAFAGLVALVASAAAPAGSSWFDASGPVVINTEVVNLTGAIHTVTPPDPIWPSDPMMVHVNLAGVTGVGAISGIRYQIVGAGSVLVAPGSDAVVPGFRVIVPGGSTLPQDPMRVHVTISADGFVTGAWLENDPT